jgi:hypothetical protein
LLAAVARGELPLGGPSEETMMAPSAGVLGAGVLGAAALADPNATQMFDEVPAGHSGSLLDGQAPTQAVPYYDEDDYPEGTGYPEDDYDGYGDYRDDDQQYAAGGVPPGLAATRAVPIPPHEQGPYADDRYDDYDDEPAPPPRRAQTSPADDDDEKPGAWKRPAIIGGIVVVGLVALAVWLLSPNNPEAPASPISSSKPTPTATSESLPSTTEESPSTAEVPPPVEETTSSSKRTTSRQTEPQTTPKTTPKTTTSVPTTTPTTPTTPTTETPPTGNNS